MESMMFTWGEPLEAKMAADVFNITKEEAYECFKELQAEYGFTYTVETAK